MHLLFAFAISIAIFGSAFTDEEENNKKERVVAYYKCVACGDDETLAAYDKCNALKPEKGHEFAAECKKKLIPEEFSEKADMKKYLCENPNVIGKIYDCLATDEHKKALTAEDIASYMKFKECAKSMSDQYCKHAE